MRSPTCIWKPARCPLGQMVQTTSRTRTQAGRCRWSCLEVSISASSCLHSRTPLQQQDLPVGCPYYPCPPGAHACFPTPPGIAWAACRQQQHSSGWSLALFQRSGPWDTFIPEKDPQNHMYFVPATKHPLERNSMLLLLVTAVKFI